MPVETVENQIIDAIADELHWAPTLLKYGRQSGLVVTATKLGQDNLRNCSSPLALALTEHLCPVPRDPWCDNWNRHKPDMRLVLGFTAAVSFGIILLLSLAAHLLFPARFPGFDSFGISILDAGFGLIAWALWPTFKQNVVKPRS